MLRCLFRTEKNAEREEKRRDKEGKTERRRTWSSASLWLLSWGYVGNYWLEPLKKLITGRHRLQPARRTWAQVPLGSHHRRHQRRSPSARHSTQCSASRDGLMLPQRAALGCRTLSAHQATCSRHPPASVPLLAGGGGQWGVGETDVERRGRSFVSSFLTAPGLLLVLLLIYGHSQHDHIWERNN